MWRWRHNCNATDERSWIRPASGLVLVSGEFDWARVAADAIRSSFEARTFGIAKRVGSRAGGSDLQVLSGYNGADREYALLPTGLIRSPFARDEIREAAEREAFSLRSLGLLPRD